MAEKKPAKPTTKKAASAKAKAAVKKTTTRETVADASNGKKALEQTSSKTKVRVASNRRYDWDTIETHYIENKDTPSLRLLAEAYGVPYQSLRDRSALKRWPQLRAKYQTDLAQKAQKERQKFLVKEAVTFDDRSLQAAKLGVNVVTGRLAQIAQLFEAGKDQHNATVQKLRDGSPVTLADLRSIINYKEVNELAAALERLQAIGRRALGTDNNTLDLNITHEGEVSHTVSVSSELQKFDSDRMAGVLDVLQRAGITSLRELEEGPKDDDNVQDAEVVEDEEDDDDEEDEG